jgi:hypothetical protein
MKRKWGWGECGFKDDSLGKRWGWGKHGPQGEE